VFECQSDDVILKMAGAVVMFPRVLCLCNESKSTLGISITIPAISMQGKELSLQWLSYRCQAALLMFLKAASCLAQQCGSPDDTNKTAASYVSRGIKALDNGEPGMLCIVHCERYDPSAEYGRES
jgi:hypothetical protein